MIAGDLFEFLQRPSVVNVYAVASAAGLELTYNVGSEVFVQNQQVSGANRFPTRDQDFLSQGVGGPGERIVLQFFNSTAGALTVSLIIDISPVR